MKRTLMPRVGRLGPGLQECSILFRKPHEQSLRVLADRTNVRPTVVYA